MPHHAAPEVAADAIDELVQEAGGPSALNYVQTAPSLREVLIELPGHPNGRICCKKNEKFGATKIDARSGVRR
jgi:hypothetical protein